MAGDKVARNWFTNSSEKEVRSFRCWPVKSGRGFELQESSKLAKQKIVVDLLHQLALGADRVERLQQRSPQQPFRRDRLPPGTFVKRLELPIERGQHLVHDRPDRAQRMRRRYPLLHIHIREQGTRSRI